MSGIATGREIVRTVRGENVPFIAASIAYVDSDPGLKTTLLTKLGWGDTDADDGYPLQADRRYDH
jgi:hypothetical protein